MKYCKQCGVLYSSTLTQCPKCNAALIEHEEPPAPEAPTRVKVRHWLGLCVGIPVLIGILYLAASIVARLS